MNSTSETLRENVKLLNPSDLTGNLLNTFSSLNSSQLNFLNGFRNQCISLELEKLLCENTLTELRFNCDFPVSDVTYRSEMSVSPVVVAKIVVTCVACVFGLLGNLLVVLAMPPSSSSKSPINFFLINLSMADILISVICVWDNLLRSLSYNYILGEYGCKGGEFIHMACLFVSVFTLVGIAIDRVYAVLFPLKARLTSPSPRWTVGVIWAFGLAAAVPFLTLRQYRIFKWNDFTEVQCSYNHGQGQFDPKADPNCELEGNYVNTYHLMVTILLYFVPVAVMILGYLLIIRRLWNTSNFDPNSTLISRPHVKAKKRAVFLAAMVLAAFLICWTPLQALILISVFGESEVSASSGNRQTFWIYFLAYLNSSVNPVIYGSFSKSYRAAIVKMVRKGKQKKGFSFLFGRNRTTRTVSFSLPKSECLSLRHRISRNSVQSMNASNRKPNQEPDPKRMAPLAEHESDRTRKGSPDLTEGYVEDAQETVCLQGIAPEASNLQEEDVGGNEKVKNEEVELRVM